MGKKILSIEIGLHTTKVCELEAKKKNPHVINCITFDTPDNIVEDGFILDKELMAQTLKSQLAKAKMNVKDVNITIASTKIANREVVIPNIGESKIQGYIDTNASDYFPLDVSEYTISYTILEKISTKEEKKLKLLLLAAPNNLIKNIYAFAEVAGFRINAIDYIGNSAYQLLKKQVGSGVNVSVQINDQTTLVNVIENEKLALQRTIPYGAMNVVSAVLDNSVFGKTNSRDAMQLLMQESIINARLDMGGEVNRGVPMASEDYDRVMRELRGREDVTNTIQYIMNNVNRVLDYFMSRNSDKRINAIYLTGVGANFKGIEVLFTNETGYDVKRIDNLFAVSFAKGLAVDGNQANYLTAIGASLAPVGFVPEDARGMEKKDGNSSKIMGIVFGVACGLSVLMIAGSIGSYEFANMRQDSLKKEVEEKHYIEDIYATYAESKLSYEYAAYMYNLSSNRNYQLSQLRDMLAAVIPSNMTVKDLQSDGTTLIMNMECKPGDKYAISKLCLQLQTVPSISNPVIQSYTEDTSEGVTKGHKSLAETFTVTCDYKPFDAINQELVDLDDEVLAEEETTDTQNDTTSTDEAQ